MNGLYHVTKIQFSVCKIVDLVAIYFSFYSEKEKMEDLFMR